MKNLMKTTSPKGLLLNQKLQLREETLDYGYVDTGVPHVVIWVEDLENTPVETLGREIRFHPHFSPAGANVNFAKVTGDSSISIRTYERGVEAETLACGTGSTAAAYIGVKMGLVRPPVKVTTRGGEVLTISIEGDRPFLEGGTRWVYDGVMHTEAWEW
jgi:diaminopimelate epimerase